MGEAMLPILIKAAKESKGETRDIVIDHELPGITEEMYEWWFKNMGQTRLYKMWHPDHISFETEKTGDPDIPFISHPTEKLGKYGPDTWNFRVESKSKYPFKPKYKNYGVTSHYSDDGLLLAYLYPEYEDGPRGLKLRQTMRWPSKAPQDIVDAMVKHATEETDNFPKFLPELYKKEATKTKK